MSQPTPNSLHIPRSPDFGSQLLDPMIHSPLAPPLQISNAYPAYRNAHISASPSSSSLSTEVTSAGLSDAQRRTEAIIQLQMRETDMLDEDMVEVIAEFEANVATADAYLAIKRDPLRKMYLGSLVKRRKR